MKVSIHKCDSIVSKILHLFHKYDNTPKFSHYTMSFVVIANNSPQRIYIDVAEHNVHLSHEQFFKKRWDVVGDDHVFEVPDREFYDWLIPNLGKTYGYFTLIGHAIKKLLHFKQNPFADGTRTFICNEFALQFLNTFFNANIDTENLDLVESEKAVERIQKTIEQNRKPRQ